VSVGKESCGGSEPAVSITTLRREGKGNPQRGLKKSGAHNKKTNGGDRQVLTGNRRKGDHPEESKGRRGGWEEVLEHDRRRAPLKEGRDQVTRLDVEANVDERQTGPVKRQGLEGG